MTNRLFFKLDGTWSLAIGAGGGKWKTVVNSAFYFIIRGEASNETDDAFVHIGIAAARILSRPLLP